jgi:hypothetical protein
MTAIFERPSHSIDLIWFKNESLDRGATFSRAESRKCYCRVYQTTYEFDQCLSLRQPTVRFVQMRSEVLLARIDGKNVR